MLTTLEKLEAASCYKDAAAKVAALPARLKDEFQQAESENRKPFAVEPLTGIKSDLLAKLIDAITSDATPEVAAILAAQRKACRIPGATLYLLSEHLKLILDAAGVGADAQV